MPWCVRRYTGLPKLGERPSDRRTDHRVDYCFSDSSVAAATGYAVDRVHLVGVGLSGNADREQAEGLESNLATRITSRVRDSYNTSQDAVEVHGRTLR